MVQALLAPPYRMLPMPPQYQRTAPVDIPKEQARFRAWADIACTEWPGDLMVSAYQVISAEMIKYQPGAEEARSVFGRAYKIWWDLSEQEKDLVITEDQVQSRAREHWRVMARQISLGAHFENHKGRWRLVEQI